MRFENASLVKLLNDDDTINCEVGDVGRYIMPVIRGGDFYHKINFVGITDLLVKKTQIECIDYPRDLDIGDKVFISSNNTAIWRRPFEVVARIGLKMYQVRYKDKSFQVYLHQIIPVYLGNKHSKNVLIKEDWL